MSRRKNFATGSVSTPPSPQLSGLSLIMGTGQGDDLPEAPFYATAHPEGQLPTKDNAEVVYVTARTGDNLVIQRAQKGTTAKSIAAGWRLSNSIFVEDTLSYGSIMSSFCPLPDIKFNLPLDSGAADWYGNGGSVAHDSTDKMQGTASLKITTDGGAQFEGGEYDLTGAPLDWTNKRFRVWFRCDDYAELDLATILISTDGFFDSFFFCHVNLGISSPQNGEWVELYLDAHNFAASGTPDWSTVNRIIFRGLDKGNTPVELWYDGFGVFDRGTKGFVSITFDDGWDSIYDNGKPVMDKYGIRSTQFIIPEILGESDRMTQAEVDDLHRQGHEISGHGAVSLVDLEISDGIEAVESYLQYCREWTAEHGYRGQDMWAYPNGNHTEQIQTLVNKYFSVARALAVCGQPTSAVNPRHVSARTVSGNSDTAAGINGEIDDAIANQDWLILVFHKIVPTQTVDTEFETADFDTVMQHIYDSGYTCLPMGEVLRRL